MNEKVLEALKERRTRDDPAGRRRDCVGVRNRQPNGDAIPPRAARPPQAPAAPLQPAPEEPLRGPGRRPV